MNVFAHLFGLESGTPSPELLPTIERVARERGASHELVLLDGVGHTFDLQTWAKKPLPQDLRPVFLAFLAKHLK